MHEREIAFLDAPCLHRVGQTPCGKRVFCNEHGTARFTVKPCDGTEHEGGVAIIIRESVGERVLKMPV